MSCGREEVFGPVTFIKRIDDFEEGLAIANASRFANGACIFTESGYYAREFARRTTRDGGGERGYPRAGGLLPLLPGTRTRSSATCTCWAGTGSPSTPRPRS